MSTSPHSKPESNSKFRVSMVSCAAATKTQDANAIGIIQSIRSGKWRIPVEKIRERFSRVLKQTGDLKKAKAAVDSAKKKLPGFITTGLFSSREKPAAEKLLKHSGLFCADLDNLGEWLRQVLDKLKTSLYLFGIFVSPTGNGLKAIFRVSANPADHAATFRAVQSHVRELCGKEIDESCGDIARLCFASFDPDAWLNPDAIQLPLFPEGGKQTHHDDKSSKGTPNFEMRCAIAEKIVGPIREGDHGEYFCVCPGRHLHTTGDGERDCKIYLGTVPTLTCFHSHCAGIREAVNLRLRSEIGKAEFVRRTKPGGVASEYLEPETQPAPWPEPRPLPSDLPAVPAFNFDCLPETLRRWIEDISERMQCPPDYPAVGAIVALGAIVGRKIGIRPKRQDDWLVVPNLWGLIVGRPGLMKTPSLEQALLPLRRLVAEALEQYKLKISNYDADALIEAQRSKIAEGKIKAYLKKGNDLKARATAEALTGVGVGKPVLRRYEVNDSTVAKLGELLAENPNGLLIHRDELVGLLRGLDKEGNEESRAFYLEAWNGTGSFTFDRIGRGTVRVESNTLSMIGGIQPDLLTGYVREAVRGGVGADGLLQRFQLAVWPDVSKQWRNVDRWPDTKAKSEAFAILKYLDDLTAECVGADASDGIPFLRFASPAQERFDLWRAELEISLRSDNDHPAFEAHLAKYRKLVPALALLFHLANRETGPVTLSALNKAFIWANYLEAHARRIYSAVLRPDTAAARELAKHLKRGELPQRFSLREAYRKGWAGLSSKEDAEAATEILCDLNWLRSIETARITGRPPSPAFETNPRIRQTGSGELTEPTEPTSDSSVSGSTCPASDNPS